MTTLQTLRDHVARWQGLNATDALDLIDIAEAAGVRIEHGFPDFGEDMAPDEPSEHVTFVDAETAAGIDGGTWTRLVGPWRKDTL